MKYFSYTTQYKKLFHSENNLQLHSLDNYCLANTPLISRMKPCHQYIISYIDLPKFVDSSSFSIFSINGSVTGNCNQLKINKMSRKYN